ncbi:MAG TPA: glutamyl-tRNA reductase [Candidatus Didemnitutus sp.]|nr:glutamyl-tRNA reductase [Candidatus Didemnitutus sp.]
MENPAALLFVGVSHHTAPLAVRERLTLDGDRAAQLADRLRADPAIREFALLSTCNRTEIYAVAASPAAGVAAQQYLAEVSGCAPDDLGPLTVHRNDVAVIDHLFGVAAGLDSQIVGEAEILGQVKEAYHAALERNWTGPVLNRVFQKTFQTAKHIRTHTALGEGQISIATVAVDLAGKIFGSLEEISILVVGAGDIGLKTIQAFQSRGARKITVASRTLSKAEEAAAQAGGWAVSMSELPEILPSVDIVASSTSAPYAHITQNMVAYAMRRRPQRPLFLVDLALPRDIEPGAAEVADVYLYNLDDLARIAEDNLARRKAEVARGQTIVSQRSVALWPQVERQLGDKL